MTESGIVLVYAVILLLLNLLGIATALGGISAVDGDVSWRIVLGGVLICIVPGLSLGQALRLRAYSILDALALSFGLSTGISLVFTLIAFLFKWSILNWLTMLFVWNISWILAWFPGIADTYRWASFVEAIHFSFNRRQIFGTLLILGPIALMSFGMYRWGDTPAAVGFEVAIQLFYVQQYASGLPLDASLTVLRPGSELALPNLFFLWEFILAGIGRVANVDVLVAALRSRWLIPLLGFSSFFFMVLQITRSLRLTQQVACVILIAILTQFFILPPNPFVAADLINDFRGITLFWGSIHHSDTAMEMLLPLCIGFLFRYLHRPRWRELGFLVGILTVSFFWHPREYFQVMWYGAVALIAGSLVERFWMKRNLYIYGRLFGMFLVLSICIFAFTQLNQKGNQTKSNELALKKEILIDLVTKPEQTFRLMWPKALFDFHFHGLGEPNQNSSYSWLLLSALLLPCLLVNGSRRILRFTFFYVALWFLTLCLPLVQTLLIAFTYSEILHSQIRFLYLFSYVVLGLGWISLAKIIDQYFKSENPFTRLSYKMVTFAILGFAYSFAWYIGEPKLKSLTLFTTMTVWIFVAIALSILKPTWKGYNWWRKVRQTSIHAIHLRMWGPALCFAIFLLPLGPKAKRFYQRLRHQQISMMDLYADHNPTGLSAGIISYLQKSVPARNVVLIDPRLPHLVGMYAPVYVTPLGWGNILADVNELEQARQGRNPIFRALNQKFVDECDLESPVTYVRRKNADFILATGLDKKFLEDLVQKNPDIFHIAYIDVSNVLVQVKK